METKTETSPFIRPYQPKDKDDMIHIVSASVKHSVSPRLMSLVPRYSCPRTARSR